MVDLLVVMTAGVMAAKSVLMSVVPMAELRAEDMVEWMAERMAV